MKVSLFLSWKLDQNLFSQQTISANKRERNCILKTAGGNDPWHGTAENCLSELVRNAEHVQQVSIQ
jgi:hypothetical protein